MWLEWVHVEEAMRVYRTLKPLNTNADLLRGQRRLTGLMQSHDEADRGGKLLPISQCYGS